MWFWHLLPSHSTACYLHTMVAIGCSCIGSLFGCRLCYNSQWCSRARSHAIVSHQNNPEQTAPFKDFHSGDICRKQSSATWNSLINHSTACFQTGIFSRCCNASSIRRETSCLLHVWGCNLSEMRGPQRAGLLTLTNCLLFLFFFFLIFLFDTLFRAVCLAALSFPTAPLPAKPELSEPA